MILNSLCKLIVNEVRLKELSRAQTHLILLGLALGNEDTLKEV